MDSTRNADNVHDQARSCDKPNRRQRHRRSKPSTLGARLNPDFNPIDMVRQEACLLSNGSVRKTHNNDELDPKTMYFDELVNLLHPSFISDHLQKVLHFLKTDKSELCFPNIAPFKEAFLVKIVEDNSHLKCSGFNDISRIVAKQILEVIYLNKAVYKWTHSYESGRVDKNVLVYRKKYMNSSPDGQTSSRIPSSPTPNSPALTSSVEDLHLSHSETRQGIPTSFKVEMLNTTLKFIKDDTRTNLEYAEMPLNQAEYLYSFIYPACRGTGARTVGFGFKSLCAPLYECMAALDAKYEFVVTFLDTNNVETARISLRKVPKASSDPCDSWRNRDINTLNDSTESRDSGMSKTQREIASKRKVIEGVSESFKIDALRDVLDLMCDEKRASLEFRNVGVKESRFLELITSLSRREDLYHLFSVECVLMMKKISRTYRRENWKMQMDVGKLDKQYKQRTFTMFKVPNEKGLAVKSRAETSEKSRNAVGSEAERHRGLSKERRAETSEQSRNAAGSEAERRRGISKERRVGTGEQSRNAAGSETERHRGISKERRIQPPLNRSIAFQSAAETTTNTVDVQPADCAPRLSRRSKLVEAMSTPLESDVAERMMRRMGWDGGGLGLRGEGITEPLMPALHIAPGAGFGHEKHHAKPPQTQRSASEFRRLFLQHLLTFIQSDQQNTTLSFQDPLSERDARFVTPALASFNDRKHVGLGREKEMRLVRQIVQEMLRDEGVALECQISADRKLIHLQKAIAAPCSNSARKRRKRSKAADCDLSSSTNSDSRTTSKSAKVLACKFVVLEKIKEFLSAEETQKEFNFEFVLSLKLRSYVQHVITNVNKRAIVNFNSKRENDLYVDIRRSAADCYMSVECYAQKFVLQKKYYQKRFTNSALDLPPPKSKDIENTVIYTNNVPHHNGCVKNNDNISDDDDDVILVDNVMEVIVLTDSDETSDSQVKKPRQNTPDSVVETTDCTNCTDFTSVQSVDVAANCTDSIAETTNLLPKNDSSFQQTLVSEPSTHSVMKPDLIAESNDSVQEISEELRNSDSLDSMVSMTKNLYLATDLMVKTNELLPKTGNSQNSVNYGDSTDLVEKSVNIDEYPFENDSIAKLADITTDPTVEKTADELDKSSDFSCKTPDSDNDSADITTGSPKTPDLPEEKAVSYCCIESDSDTDCDGIMSKDLSVDISNDSLLVDMLEAENDVEVKLDSSTDSELERDIKNMLEVIENSHTDDFVEFSDIKIKTEPKESLDLDLIDKNKSIDLSSQISKEQETDNNHNVVKEDHSKALVKVERRILDFPEITKYVDETDDNITIENIDDLSPVSSKRSRTDSGNSYTTPRKLMKLEKVQSVAIAPTNPDEKISDATLQKLQTLISKEIDGCDFMPLLECRGVKNGGLMYSCHNEESFMWLKNVVSVASDLNLKITETDIGDKDSFKLRIKVNSLEDPCKVLRRLEQYNPTLHTACWQVLEVQTNRYFVVITVVVDGVSYKVISAANFSLFAGTDRAQFSVVWD